MDSIPNDSRFNTDYDKEAEATEMSSERFNARINVSSKVSFDDFLVNVSNHEWETAKRICSNRDFNLTYANVEAIAGAFVGKDTDKKSVLRRILEEYHNSKFASDVYLNSKEGKGTDTNLKTIGEAIKWLTDYQLPTLFHRKPFFTAEDDRFFPVRNLFFLAVMNNQGKLADLIWQELDRDQLPTAIMASFLWKSCSEKLKDREAMFNLSRQMHKKAKKYEERAKNILHECFEEDPAKAHLLLVYSMDKWDKRTVLSMAYAGEQMDFFAHDCCQKNLSESWYGQLQSYTPKWKIAIGIFFPLFVLCGNMLKTKNENKENRQNGRRCKCFGESLYDFYNAPIVKFCTHTLSYLIFLVLFSIVMLTQLTPKPKDVSVFEYLVWVWTCSMYVDELRLLFNGWKAVYFSCNPFKNDYFNSWWNLYDQLLFWLLILAVILRYSLPIEQFEGTLNVYALAFVFYVLRVLQDFYVVQALGPKIEIIYRMLKDLFIFLLIFVLFIFAFGIAFQALVHPNPATFKSLSVSNETILLDLFKHIIYMPYFVIVQQFDGLKDQVENCASLNYSSIDTGLGISRCSKLANVFYIIYTLISSLLLVNLLIATFSGSYERISEDATKTWLYYRFEIISEFIEKPVLPPPLIVVNHVWRFIQSCTSHKRSHALKLNSNDIAVKCGMEAKESETALQELQNKAFKKINEPNYNSPGHKESDAYEFKKALKDVEQDLKIMKNDIKEMKRSQRNTLYPAEVPDDLMNSGRDSIPNLSHGTMRSDGFEGSRRALGPRGNNFF